MEEKVSRKPDSGRIWIAAVLATVGLLIAVYVTVFQINRFSIVLQVDSAPELTIAYGDGYTQPQSRVLLKGTLFLKEGRLLEETPVTVQGTVDPGTLGTYTVTYSAEYNGLQASQQRTVHVTDTVAPVISLVSSGEPMEKEGPYEEEGFTASDNHDGDLTALVQRQELYGLIVYTVEDSSGNVTSVERKIPYYDPIPPTILLEGDMYMPINTGTIWEDPGFTTVDNVAGDLTEQTVVEGEVDPYHPGLYFINYTATDTHDNQRTATRLVEVIAQERPKTVMPEGRVIYLTFDDGPGPYTEALLEVLAKYDVKATFFVVNGEYNHVMKQIVDQGHSIGIHSVSHDYETIYASPEAYFADLTGMQEIIYQNTGVRTTLMRFPGGGSNLVSRKISRGIMSLLSQAVQDAGYQYFDWNVYSGDAGETQKASEVCSNVIDGVSTKQVSMVLQHDIHPYSVEAVEDIIVWALDNGYRFLPLDPTSPNFHHYVAN